MFISDFVAALFGRRRKPPVPPKPLPTQERDVPYGADPLQKLDVYRPDGMTTKDKAPVVLMVHGGGWDNTKGDKANSGVIDAKRDYYLAQGKIVVSINYRLFTPTNGITPLQEAQDVAAAFAFAQKLPGVGEIDLMGHSAGAHLVALAATALGVKARRIVCLDGIYDVEMAIKVGKKTGAGDQYAPFGTDPTKWPGMTPIDNATGQEPPFLLCYSTAEGPQRKKQADNFAAAVNGTAQGFPYSHGDMDALVGTPCDLTDAIDKFLAG